MRLIKISLIDRITHQNRANVFIGLFICSYMVRDYCKNLALCKYLVQTFNELPYLRILLVH